jgi:DNA-binding NarL/FixJ family response regulator
LRAGLVAVLQEKAGVEVVGEAVDGPDALDLVERVKPDVLVLDLMMPGMSGIEVARRVSRQRPDTRMVILTLHTDDAIGLAALQSGAHGLVTKGAAASELLRAIRTVAAGGRAFPARLTAAGAGSAPADPWESLTDREREVMMLLTEGHQNADVAVRLGISVRTVEVHRAAGLRKLHLSGVADLVRLLVRRGLVSPHE